MRTVGVIASSLVAVVAVTAFGCGGSEDFSQEKPDSPRPPAVTSPDEGRLLLPGDQREPGAATVTTRMRLPIARTSSPARKPVPTTRPATAPTTAITTVVPPG